MKEDNGCYHYIYIYTHTRARASGRQDVLIWNYYWLLRSYDVVASKCMQERNSKGFNIKAKEFSIKPVCDSRTNHLEERENDTIQSRSDSDFWVKFPII
jgi:hypothetical protein